MKKLLYILYLGILLVGCAQEKTKSLQKRTEYNIVEKSENTKYEQQAPATDKKANRNVKLDKRILKEATSNRKKTTNDNTLDANYFDEIGQQKLQQLLDIALLLSKKKTQNEMKTYATKHAKRLFVPKQGFDINTVFSRLHFPSADSIVIREMSLINMTEADSQSQIGNYKLHIQVFYAGMKRLNLQKTAKILFETTDLELNDRIYKTIKGKILEFN